MITAKGHSGTVAFDGQFVIITREGLLARMNFGKGEKRIALRSITAVQVEQFVGDGGASFGLGEPPVHVDGFGVPVGVGEVAFELAPHHDPVGVLVAQSSPWVMHADDADRWG